MPITVEEYAGPHRDLAWSFREVEHSERLLNTYIDLGRVWVARTDSGEIVGHLQAVARDARTWEVASLALVESVRRQGWGRRLLEHAAEQARQAGASRVIVSTAAADVGNLRFYQRCGFRMTHVVRDAFTAYQGYPDGLEIDGIPLRDQVWFDRRV
ncbi:MAG: GNAT family N-acetyltransferase [Nocardioides sp.]|nr:GNAT family N-acetyltransferase [Nocardioides sp.]